MNTKGSTTGVILANLGTPNTPNILSVGKYLREFLSDPQVITLPTVFRWMLVNFIILPFRTHKTTKAYKSIWSKEGSPLLANSKKSCEKVASQLGDDYKVALGMRYGSPSLEQALQTLLDASCNKIILLPMYPQYASSTTGSSIAKLLELLSKQSNKISTEVRAAFFENSAYINALADTITENLSQDEYLLFSYHGLPENQNNCIQLSTCYAKNENCFGVKNNSKTCYRYQCYTTSELVANKLGLSSKQYGVSFQSRLGALPWIKPYTDEFLTTLIESGVKNLAVACPSFVADCLETLEEVGIKLRQQWQDLGGTNFKLLPCLNSHNSWIDAIVKMIKK